MTIDLGVFRTAKHLQWKRHTVFAPNRGDDGNLIADGAHSLPLDTYTPDTGTAKYRSQPPITEDGIGIVVVDPETLEEVHNAVRAWCRNVLDRDDIHFTE
jgi:hypothetical protein